MATGTLARAPPAMIASPSLWLGVIARAPMAFVRAAGLCMCSERLVLVRRGLNCTSRQPSCTC
eukprot:1732015-Alexandrium_andersonii.AAC.1